MIWKRLAVESGNLFILTYRNTLGKGPKSMSFWCIMANPSVPVLLCFCIAIAASSRTANVFWLIHSCCIVVLACLMCNAVSCTFAGLGMVPQEQHFEEPTGHLEGEICRIIVRNLRPARYCDKHSTLLSLSICKIRVRTECCKPWFCQISLI